MHKSVHKPHAEGLSLFEKGPSGLGRGRDLNPRPPGYEQTDRRPRPSRVTSIASPLGRSMTSVASRCGPESRWFKQLASSVLDRTDSLRYIRVRLASTVLTDMKSSAAVS